MKSIFGRVNRTGLLNIDLFNNALLILGNYPHKKLEKVGSESFGFAQVLFKQEPELSFFNSEGYIVVADCRIDNKDELIEKLQIKGFFISDDQIIIKAFKRWGIKCPEYLLGDFAFAIWDKRKRELFCARDHFGVKPFYYCFDGENFIFGSELKTILSQNDTHFSVDEQYIADTLSVVKSEKDRTTYSEIKRLPPAHVLVLKNFEIEVIPYWELKPQKIGGEDNKEVIKQFKELIIQSIKCRIPPDAKVGAELSGGLDSSSITAVASKFTNLSTFSHVLPDHLLGKIFPFKDESTFIRQLIDYCKIKDSFFITSENSGIVEAIEQNVIDFGYVSQQNFEVFSDLLYKTAAKNEVTVLLSGFSGDEMITSKSHNYLLELAQNNFWNEIKEDLKNQELNRLRSFKRILYLFVKVKMPHLFSFFHYVESQNLGGRINSKTLL